jgi:hypothetical protein
MGGGAGWAGSSSYDFDADPSKSGVIMKGSGGYPAWRASGGASGGYLALLDAVSGTQAAVMFPDLDAGQVVQGFSFDVDLRVGNATGGGRPADGFSVNFARSNDAVVDDMLNGRDPANDFAVPGQLENGVASGVAICFDTWQGNALPDGSDLEGLIVRVDNQTLLEQPMPDRNGVSANDPSGLNACTDTLSMQTGPYDGLDTGSPDNLCWAHLHVELTADSLLTVVWKGAKILDRQPIDYSPGPGRLIFAGRTGGANENTHIDNVTIASIATPPPPDTTAPAMAALDPPAGAVTPTLTQIEVIFTENVAGVDAADLLLNGKPAASVAAMSGTDYIFAFPQPTNGLVQISWSPVAGIKDLAGNAFNGEGWTCTLDPSTAITGVAINEIMAANKKTLRDEDGDSSDWIELYNAGAATVDLAGWFLSDDATQPARWKLPRVTLLSKQCLVVFASGKNRANSAAPLHTDFLLAQAGGYLSLSDPATNVVSAFSYPGQSADVSYGRNRTTPTVLGYFPIPTPGAPNSQSGPGYAPSVEFSQSGCTFLKAFALALTTPATNAVIHYEIGASMPTELSPVFAGPITITNSLQIRARAFVPGLLPGPPRSEAYLALSPTVTNFTSNLPVLVIHNFKGGPIPAGSRKFAELALFEPGAGRTSLTNPPAMSQRAGISLRGSSTLYQEKGNFRVEFWDEFGSQQNRKFLGLPSDADWVLYACDNFEPVLIHNPFMHNLSRSIGRYSSRVRLIEVYLNTSGGPVTAANYNGVYVLEEKVKIGKNRVDIDKLEPEQVSPQYVSGGYLMSIDRSAQGEGQMGVAGQGINPLDPSYSELTQPQRATQWNYINDYLRRFYTALEGAAYADPLKGYAQFIDVDAWIDHHILNTLAFNVDSLRLSTYFYKPRNGKLAFGPLWDFDRALGSTDGRDSNPRLWSTPDGSGTDMFHYPWWDRLFTDPDFWQKWIDRWQELRRGPFSLGSLQSQVSDLTGQLIEAQRREVARWPGFTSPRGGSYAWEINAMKTWLSNRVDFIDTNFVTAPTLSPISQPDGVAVTLSAQAGSTIYYTLDGSDPRLPGGAVSAKALAFQKTIAVTANARVVARAYNAKHRNLSGAAVNPPISSPWSGPAAATFTLTTPALRITEMMYHDASPGAGDTNAVGNYSYVELQNTGDSPINLIGFKLSGAIDYTFSAGSGLTQLAPGAFVLVVANRAAFLSRHPSVANIAGDFTGSLPAGGGELVLTGPMQEPILDFSYDPNWVPVTDGLGFALVIKDPGAPSGAWSDGGAWRGSSRLNGSPGVPDPLPPALPGVLVNEALASPGAGELDSIELYNPEPAAVDIGGWFLSDDFQQPRKYAIPSPTIIPSGSFRVFTAAEFGFGTNGFGLSALGDSVHLFSGDGTNITGYTHGFKFEPSFNGETIGRHVTSEGREHFVRQARATLGAPNAGPRVGPIVITEIMCHPPLLGTNADSLNEYVEIMNLTSLDVPLFDLAAPTNAWLLKGAVGFTFPPECVLRAKGCALVVGFDPDSSPVQLALFRAKYSVDAATPIFGPYSGGLESESGTLKLYEPGKTQGPTNPHPGETPYILVDQASYAGFPPWPDGANHTGKSLQRVEPGSYGADPMNWQAAPPTAGRPGVVIFPSLHVSAASQQIVLSWPLWASDYLLESSKGLAGSEGWSTVDATPSPAGGMLVATLPSVDAATFYRLRQLQR